MVLIDMMRTVMEDSGLISLWQFLAPPWLLLTNDS